ncbi:MAG: PAS domain S-box protein, partial [Bacteroidales bacterium]|nr:PAS domain S-box protein [Bacteroidales bacterium]
MSQSSMNKSFGDCKEIMQNALRSVGDPLICIDLNLAVNFINSAAENLIEYSFNELSGKNIDEYLNIFDGLSNEKKENLVAEILKSKTNFKLSENTILISKTGKKHNVLFSGAPIQTSEGDLLGAIISLKDISSERIAELKFLESEKRFDNIFEASADAIYVLKNDVIDACNIACLKLLKYENESEIVGKKPDIIFAEYQYEGVKSSEKIKSVTEILEKKGSHRFDWIHSCADNSNIECE